jgi:hypothetical protein
MIACNCDIKEDEQGPTSWLDFVAPSELIPQVDPALNPNEVAVAAPSRGNYTMLMQRWF